MAISSRDSIRADGRGIGSPALLRLRPTRAFVEPEPRRTVLGTKFDPVTRMGCLATASSAVAGETRLQSRYTRVTFAGRPCPANPNY